MYRMFFAALVFALSSSAGAEIVVSEGDSYASLTVGFGDSLHMTGGVVEEGKFFGNTHVIDGGTLGVRFSKAIQHDAGILEVRGGNWQNGIFRSYDVSSSTINFYGHYFRYTDDGRREFNAYRIEGVLLDGSFLSITVSNNTDLRRTSQLPINFIVEPGIPPEGDANGDWMVDLADLNILRNGFGSPASRDEGDMDGNGMIDLADLNMTRNDFGDGSFGLSLSDDRTIEVRESTSVSPNTGGPFFSVPEPPAFAIAAVLLLAMSRSLRSFASSTQTQRRT